MTPPATDPSDGQDDRGVAGCEWIVDAQGCAVPLLQSLPLVRQACERIIKELGLSVVGTPLWHQFPGPGGVTGLYLLSESHLTCHTWPERGLATFNLFCCRRRREWPWQSRLQEILSAESVAVRVVERGLVPPAAATFQSTGGLT